MGTPSFWEGRKHDNCTSKCGGSSLRSGCAGSGDGRGGLVRGEPAEFVYGEAGGGVSQSGCGVCVAVPLSAAGVFCGGECCHAAAGARYETRGGVGEGQILAGRGGAGGSGFASLGRVERRGAAE